MGTMSFLCRVAGFIRDGVTSFVIQEGLGAEAVLLCNERRKLKCLGHLIGRSPGRLPDEVFWECPTGNREVSASLLRLLPLQIKL